MQRALVRPVLFVLTGPESSAKTTLATALSEHFHADLVPEIARDYLQDNAHYLPSDLLQIAALQQYREEAARSHLVIADTDLQVINIWWSQRFGPVPARLYTAYAQQKRRHYLLCKPDTVWEPDPLRENPQDRDRLFEVYERDLQSRSLDYSIVRGLGDARIACAIDVVQTVTTA